MTQRSTSANNSLLVSRNAIDEAFGFALRLFIGRGKRYRAEQVAHATGVAKRMIESAWLPIDNENFRQLDVEQMISLTRFLGPEFTTEWLRLADQGACWLPESDDTPPGVLAADIADSAAAVTRAASDGKFDRQETHDLRATGVKLIAIGGQLARGGERRGIAA